MLDEAPMSADATFDEATRLSRERRYREAIELCRAIIDSADPSITKKRRRMSYAQALVCTLKVGDWVASEAMAREALVPYGAYAVFHLRLGEALLRQERFEEAQAELVTALELDPASQEAPLLLELARTKSVAPTQARVAPWPVRQRSFKNQKFLIRRYVLGSHYGEPFITPDSVFMTVGSCFAQNLAFHLRRLGRTVHATEIGEDVNSTYANRYLLEWVENGATSAATTAIQDAYGPAMREQLRAQIAESDVFVMTLGVAPCFFRKDNGEFAFVVSKTPTAGRHRYANNVMRMTTVAENSENIRCIMSSISRLARRTPKFVLTVSPVPLGGTTERQSAVIADCVSKSTLRLAADLVCGDPAGHSVTYWPSFEIVRWLSPHFDRDLPPPFGAEDGNTRHVSNWLVKQIVKLFIEHHSAGAKDEAEADPAD